MKALKDKKWFLFILIITFLILSVIAACTAIVDPFFHYHKPLDSLQYPLNSRKERYLNDGILKNFDYNAIITGTSMVENFKTSEFSNLWDLEAVKVPFSGGSYKEINDSLSRRMNQKKNVKIVLRSLDYSYLLSDKDAMRYEDSSYPLYLYDVNPFNDVKYVLNKSVLLNDTRQVLNYTKNGNKTTSFDEYGNWNDDATFGKAAVIDTYTRPPKSVEKKVLTEDMASDIRASIQQNVLELARMHSDTKFFLFFTPYSIVYWDSLDRKGALEQHIQAEKIAIEELLSEENIELYSFTNNFSLICNLDNYKDSAHYSEGINSQILKWINNGEYRITKENYLDYLTEIEDFYTKYNYDEIYGDNFNSAD